MLPSIRTVCLTSRCPSVCVKKSISCCAPPGHSVMWCTPCTKLFMSSSEPRSTVLCRSCPASAGSHVLSARRLDFGAHQSSPPAHRDELRKGDRAREVLHPAIRRHDHPICAHVRQRAPNPLGNHLRRLDLGRRQIENSEQNRLSAEVGEDGAIERGLRRFDGHLLHFRGGELG